MIQHDPITGNTRSIRRLGPDPIRFKVSRKMRELTKLLEVGGVLPRQRLFAEYEETRRMLLQGIDRKDLGERGLYKKSGVCQHVARHWVFTLVSTLVIVANIIWLGVDANFNQAATLYDADVGFIVVENLFCAFFSLELLIRFCALKKKVSALVDAWFVFDVVLVALMVGEVWLLPLFQLTQSGGGSSPGKGGWAVLRAAKILKVARVSRTARVIRSMPELMALSKGIWRALRSVFYTMLMLGVLLYIFGIIFKTQAGTDQALLKLFPSVQSTMWLLLIEGIMLDGPKDTLNAIKGKSVILTSCFLIFIFLSAFTVMNMLIGILCNVVDQVYQSEKDEAAVAYLKNTLLELLEIHDDDDNRRIRKSEFELLMRNPEMHLVLTRFGVDVKDLIHLKESLFEDKDAALFSQFEQEEDDSVVPAAQQDLTFAEFLAVVMRLRGGNSAKVTDVVELREFMKLRLDVQREYIGERLDSLERRTLSGQAAEAQDVGGRAPAPRGPAPGLEQVLRRLDEVSAGQRELAAKQAKLEVDLGAQVRGMQAQLERLCQALGN
mmetsp:Transcript_15373/g.48445  ORF Transcript_15373/g.48445 Transcript_15373/m.48445 type:complete len:551 (-) Transcript_15373:25-1677(-)